MNDETGLLQRLIRQMKRIPHVWELLVEHAELTAVALAELVEAFEAMKLLTLLEIESAIDKYGLASLVESLDKEQQARHVLNKKDED